MSKWVTVSEAAQQLGVTERTVWRHIQQNKRPSRTTDNTRHVLLTDQDMISDMTVSDPDPVSDPSYDPVTMVVSKEKDKRIEGLEKQVASQQEEIAELHKHLAKAEEAAQQQNAIVLTLSQQLDRAHLALEDMQKKRTVWQRVKAVFAVEAS